MEIGIVSFVTTTTDPRTGNKGDSAQQVRDLLEEIELADQVGLDAFGIGEHHRAEFLDSAPVVLLAGSFASRKPNETAFSRDRYRTRYRSGSASAVRRNLLSAPALWVCRSWWRSLEASLPDSAPWLTSTTRRVRRLDTPVTS